MDWFDLAVQETLKVFFSTSLKASVLLEKRTINLSSQEGLGQWVSSADVPSPTCPGYTAVLAVLTRGGEGTVATIGWRPGMLIETPEHPGWPTERHPPQNTSGAWSRTLKGNGLSKGVIGQVVREDLSEEGAL